MDTNYRAVSASVFTHSKSHQLRDTALHCYSRGTTVHMEWQTWPTCASKRAVLLLLSAHIWTFPGLLSLDTPAQQGEIGIWCRGTVFLYRLPPQGQEKVSLPCVHLAKWENNISVITAHTKHKSLIGSNLISVNTDNNPEFKDLPVRWNSKGFPRPKAVPQPRFSFDHSLQVAPAAELFSAETQTQVHSCEEGVGWIFHCKFLLQWNSLTDKRT